MELCGFVSVCREPDPCRSAGLRSSRYACVRLPTKFGIRTCISALPIATLVGARCCLTRCGPPASQIVMVPESKSPRRPDRGWLPLAATAAYSPVESSCVCRSPVSASSTTLPKSSWYTAADRAGADDVNVRRPVSRNSRHGRQLRQRNFFELA